MDDFPAWVRMIPISEIMPRLVMEDGGTAEEARRVAVLAGPEPVPATFDGWLALERRLLEAVRAEAMGRRVRMIREQIRQLEQEAANIENGTIG